MANTIILQGGLTVQGDKLSVQCAEIKDNISQAIGKLAEPLSGCKVLLDLQDITCDLGLEDLVELKAELSNFPWTAVGKLKLAMVTTPHPEQYHGLRQLTLPVSQLGVDVEAFCESSRAIEWLADETNRRFS